MDDVDLAPVDERLKPILRYVRKLTETPSRIRKADADAVYHAGWSDEALLHAVAICAISSGEDDLPGFLFGWISRAHVTVDPARQAVYLRLA
jgi:hypothetical protein